MEQVVWVYFGILAILVGLGVTTKLVMMHQEELKIQHIEYALDRLQIQCDFVCNSPEETLQSIEAILPSGLFLYATEKKICSTYKDKVSCVPCQCTMNPYSLALNSSFAQKTFGLHAYSCSFLRMKNGTQMACQG